MHLKLFKSIPSIVSTLNLNNIKILAFSTEGAFFKALQTIFMWNVKHFTEYTNEIYLSISQNKMKINAPKICP